MAYWLVFQGTSFQRSRAGGYLWAPQKSKDNRTPFYWHNMARLAAGDMVFSGMDGAVRAISYVTASAYNAAGPNERDSKYWLGMGWRADVSYVDLPKPLRYREWVPDIRSLLPTKYGPFDRNNDGNQGYLFELPVPVGEDLIGLCREAGVDVALAAAEASPTVPGKQTQRRATILARIGQGKYREDLIERWKGRCAVSGLDRPELLRASHVKPRSACNDVERLDASNGLLLSAAYDSAFDALLISFGSNGKIELAADFPAHTALVAGISPDASIALGDSRLQRYLETHRELVAARFAKQAR